jgi:hypothetical protein
MKKLLIFALCVFELLSSVAFGQLKVQSISSTPTIKKLYSEIVERVSYEERTTYLKLIELANAIQITEETSPYYHGLLFSIYYYARNNSDEAQLSAKVQQILQRENKPFIIFELDSKIVNGENLAVVVSRHGFTQPEMIDREYLEKLGVASQEIYDEYSYNFYDLQKHLPSLFKQYGVLKTVKYDDKGSKIRESTYGDLLFDLLDKCNYQSDNEYNEEKTNREIQDFISSQMPNLKSHLLRGKAYFKTQNLHLAKYELTKAQEEEIPNEEIGNYLYEINNQLLLEKNPLLVNGLPNKKIPQGWFKPKKAKGFDDFGATSIVADFNQDGLLDEVVLLSTQVTAKFHNNMAVFTYISKPDGTFSIQKFLSNQIPQGYLTYRFFDLYDEKSKPVGGFVASLVQKNEFAEEGCVLVLFKWNKTQQKMVMEDFGSCN